MFGDKDRALKLIDGEPMTLLEKDAQFEGKLTFEGRVQINGKFRGEIFSDGILIVGEGAEVDAKIEIDTIIIQGKVSGSIDAKRRIEMHAPAVVQGDISSPGLVVSDGAVFEGACSMGRNRSGKVVELSKGYSQATEASDII
jgi:Integral membrane protein CcmA involved in cell shape determination